MTNSIPLSSLESGTGAKFVDLGDKYAGRITNIEQRQQTEMDGSPKFFKDGTSPMMQYVITLELTDGESVNLFAKLGKYTPSEGKGESMLGAIGTAVREAGASAVDVGGELAVQYTGKAEPAPGKKAKLYTASYRPPTASIPAGDLFSEQ